MLSIRRSLLLLAVAGALASCGPPEDASLKLHDSSRDFLTACASGSTLPGVDVSDYQGTINWSKVAGAGIKWAYAKATEGTGFQASTFPANWSGMKANGIARGAYHFFHAEVSGKQQADYYLAYVNANGGFAAGDLPPMLDWEQVSPNNGGASCSTAASNAQAFIDEIAAKTGKKTIIYTSPGIWDGYGCSQTFSAEGLWVANYFISQGNGCYTSNTASECPNTPSGWSSWVMWQYGDCGSVNGISGGVDVDVFNGDAAALAQLGGTTDCGGKPDGYYCGGDGPSGAADTLYKCASNVGIPEETCPSWCVASSTGDFCARVQRPHTAADVDKDGRADVCGRSSTGLTCWLAGSAADFSSSISGPGISDGQGWDGLPYYTTTQFADVNGDGKADLCARGAAGALCWFSTGTGFSSTHTAQTVMTDPQGWDQAEFRQTIQWADVNGDGKADLCGRQYNSFSCWLYDAPSNSFKTEVDLCDNASPPTCDMGDPQGWNEVQYYSTIVVADVNGDGKADVCGRGYLGFECFISTGSAFKVTPGAAVSAFSDPNGGTSPSVYSTLALADVTGDGKLDLCGRISAGYRCYAGNGDGTFSATAIDGPALSNTAGWNKPEYYTTIQLADVNGDGKADVCARDNAGIKCWLSTGSGFGSAISGPPLADSAGWSAGVYDTSIQFADVDGDGRADVCARAIDGWQCWLSTGNGFSSASITPNVLTDSSGWNKPQYLTTVELVGNAFGHHVPGATSDSSGSSSGSGSGSTGSTSGSASAATGSSGSGSTGTASGSGSTSSAASGTASSTGGETGAGTSGGGTLTTGTSDGSGGAAVGGGCTSASGGSLLGMFFALGLLRRRRAIQP